MPLFSGLRCKVLLSKCTDTYVTPLRAELTHLAKPFTQCCSSVVNFLFSDNLYSKGFKSRLRDDFKKLDSTAWLKTYMNVSYEILKKKKKILVSTSFFGELDAILTN